MGKSSNDSFNSDGQGLANVVYSTELTITLKYRIIYPLIGQRPIKYKNDKDKFHDNRNR